MVDKFDQLRNYYSSGHYEKKWWKALFFNLLDMAIANAHRCHKLKYNTSHFNFRKLLVRELFGNIDLRKKINALDEPGSSGPPIISYLALLLALLKTIFLWTAAHLLYACTVHKKVGGPQKVRYVQHSVVLNVIRDFVGILRGIVFISIIICCKFIYCYYLL